MEILHVASFSDPFEKFEWAWEQGYGDIRRHEICPTQGDTDIIMLWHMCVGLLSLPSPCATNLGSTNSGRGPINQLEKWTYTVLTHIYSRKYAHHQLSWLTTTLPDCRNCWLQFLATISGYNFTLSGVQLAVLHPTGLCMYIHSQPKLSYSKQLICQ